MSIPFDQPPLLRTEFEIETVCALEHLITPRDWAAISQRYAAEYLGMPEASYYLTEARRWLLVDDVLRAKNDQIRLLQAKLEALKAE